MWMGPLTTTRPFSGSRGPTHRRRTMLRLAAIPVLLISFAAAAETGSVERGQRIFHPCAACPSLQPDKNMPGPSLSGIWNRKAGTVASFSRYSPALKSADVVWDDQTLDAWITNPQLVIPGNEMTFPGVRDPQHRIDLLAFLKEATKPGASFAQQPSQE